MSLLQNESERISSASISRRATVFHQYAVFAERQYNSVVRSPDFLRWKVYVDRKRTEIKNWEDRISKLSRGSPEFNNYTKEKTTAVKLLQEDSRRLENFERQRDTFLEQAIVMYSRALSTADDFDEDSPIRLCSLWFANFDSATSGWQALVSLSLDRIPSRKFVFLAHQLSARLSKSKGTSSQHISLQQNTLQQIVLRMCQEHPFHSLFPVYCLKTYQPLPTASARRQSARHEPLSSQAQAERAAAAHDIFERIRHDPACGKRLSAVEMVCDAAVEAARYRINETHNGQLPQHLKILALEDVKVPVITTHTPIDLTCGYENCLWIHRYDRAFETAGGMNLPKIMRCVDSNGQEHKQLVSAFRISCMLQTRSQT